jgi:Inner membrane protein YgaP-like, transmembrane domain
MTCNIGKTDKSIRLIIGAIIALIGVYYSSWWGLLGIIPVLTVVFGFCPLYFFFKVNTCKKDS